MDPYGPARGVHSTGHVMAFHEVRFPDNISRGARGGPERRTQIVEMASGDEERNGSWALISSTWGSADLRS